MAIPGQYIDFRDHFFCKDILPDPAFYDLTHLEPPKQTPIIDPPFDVRVNGQDYTIKPKFAYELGGVIVSYHNADAFGDIWLHKRWKDFLNLRDLCVIWGDNVGSGVYQSMQFGNDSWTCWASWADTRVGQLFKMNSLSNNHLLTNDNAINKTLMDAEPGDHIRLKGVLFQYDCLLDASNINQRYFSPYEQD